MDTNFTSINNKNCLLSTYKNKHVDLPTCKFVLYKPTFLELTTKQQLFCCVRRESRIFALGLMLSGEASHPFFFYLPIWKNSRIKIHTINSPPLGRKVIIQINSKKQIKHFIILVKNL